jgi:xanthine dehydrogenase small subunit
VAVEDGITLLDALREELHCRSVKDGCSPQGQCGCCTVWVDGGARVACVTPVRRVSGRSVTTVEGLTDELRTRWVDAFAATGASQCGFCTPGILLRLAALEAGERPVDRPAIEGALRAHLCRCTGWQSIVEAGCLALGLTELGPAVGAGRDPLLASWRAQIEGPMFQSSGPEVILGGGGFADDSSPVDALVQLGAVEVLDRTAPPLPRGLRAARLGRARVQGRNSTVPLTHPVPVAGGEWALTLQTTWVEPAYVEPDASWSRSGLPPVSPLANGGAFGGKRHSPVPATARALADEVGDAVRVLWRREDVVRRGPKRPPLSLGLRGDGTGVLRLGRSPGSPGLQAVRERVARVAPGVEVEEVDISGPPVAGDLRGAGWAEVLAALHVVGRPETDSTPGVGRADVTLPEGGRATVTVTDDGGRGAVAVEVWAGEVLNAVTLRSYALGAVHQALGLVWTEGIAVGDDGVPVDLTIRSFGILAARDMPVVDVTIHRQDRWPVNGSDAVFVATLAAAWMAEGRPPRWPTRRTGGRAHEHATAPTIPREEQA